MKKKVKPVIYNKTIRKYTPLALSYSNQEKTFKVGKHTINLRRAKNLNVYGNPVYYATYVNKDGSTGAVSRSTDAVGSVMRVFEKEGYNIKYTQSKIDKKMKKANEYVNRIAREDSRW